MDGGSPDAGRPDAGSGRDGGARFVDGGINDAGVRFFVNLGDVPDASSRAELPVERVRGFTCDMAAVGAATDIADVTGAPGAMLGIRPAGDPCNFNLEYWADGGAPTTLSMSPGGYLVAAASFSGGATVVCASDAIHRPVAGGGPNEREVQQVPVRCWAFDGANWTGPLLAVPGDLQAAAWVEKIAPVTGMSGTFTLTWVRDSTFQFMNSSDNGRPAGDGIFELQLSLGGMGLTAGAASQVSSSVQLEPAVNSAWEPTPAELEYTSGIITVDAGPCPDGCLLDAGP